jgi:hypothetical protein
MRSKTILVLLFCVTAATMFAAKATGPVVVELFTSEGCSSCPPADELLSELAKQGSGGIEVIALSEHVDYWDSLGWRDPFSSPLFSQRQQAYGQQFQLKSVFTPQMVVDGFVSLNGTDRPQAGQFIRMAARSYPKAVVSIRRSDTSADERTVMSLRVEQLAEAQVDQADVFVAVTESGLSTRVAAGENEGHVLRHSAVVRTLTRVTGLDAHKGSYAANIGVNVDRRWQHGNVRVVLLVQDPKTGRIVGAASCPL